MTVYVPNIGEKDALKAILGKRAIQLGLYKTQIVPDGTLLFSSLDEMPTGGGRGYALKELVNAAVEGSPAASLWSLALNSSGQAQAQYDVAAQVWTMAAADVADANTVYGVFGYVLRIPFTGGAVQINPGDTIKGASSGATGIVTDVLVTSGSWALGTAAGSLWIKTKTGTFVNAENIYLVGKIATVAVNAGGTGYAVGDILSITQAGAAGAKLVVSSIGGGGAVTGVVVVEGGHSYSVASGLATTHLTGGGNDACTINISTLATTTMAVSATGTVNAGDALKDLIFVEALTTPQVISAIGQQLGYTPVLVMSTST